MVEGVQGFHVPSGCANHKLQLSGSPHHDFVFLLSCLTKSSCVRMVDSSTSYP